MTHAPPDGLLRPGDTCWRVEDATKVAVIIDADKYFRVARAAMCKAQRRIMMIGWDFDARIELDRSGDAMDGPTSIGRFIEWLVDRNEDLEVYLLRWDVGRTEDPLSWPHDPHACPLDAPPADPHQARRPSSHRRFASSESCRHRR